MHKLQFAFPELWLPILKELAAEKGLSMAAYIRLLIRDDLIKNKRLKGD